MHKKRFNETSVKITTSETHKTQIKHVSNPTETSETEMKRMNRLKHGSWSAGYLCLLMTRLWDRGGSWNPIIWYKLSYLNALSVTFLSIFCFHSNYNDTFAKIVQREKRCIIISN